MIVNLEGMGGWLFDNHSTNLPNSSKNFAKYSFEKKS